MAAVTVAELPFRPDTPLESEDDDNFNTANARIHFGQLKSPEKKLRSEAREEMITRTRSWSLLDARSKLWNSDQTQFRLKQVKHVEKTCFFAINQIRVLASIAINSHASSH